MSNMCSPEEIERKRLLALQRREQAKQKICNNTHMNSPKQLMQQTKQNNYSNIVKQNKISNRFNPIEPKNFFNHSTTVTGKCYMISTDRFALETSSFVPAIIEVFKSVQSRQYDIKSRTWNFHINDYDNLIQKLLCHKFKLSMTKIPNNILHIFKKNLTSGSQTFEVDLTKIDEKLIDSLIPFQKDGICYGISKNGRCMIADDMGLGKTIQALGIAHYFKASWPLLIVVPSSVRFQWSETIYEFLPSIPAHYIHHFANTKDGIGDDKITIISYDLLVRAIHILEKHIYGFIILDESHILKSSKTARFRAVQRICTQAQHVVLLTGTPVLSRPVELYSQINLIRPHFMKFEEYGIRYCAGRKTSFGWDFTGSSNMQELQFLLKAMCVIRRLKADVLSQLPSKIRQVIILDPELIKTGTKQMKQMLEQMQKKTTGIERHNDLLQYYAESSVARLKAVCNYVTNIFENKRKCLLYAHHKNILDAICELAESMQIRYIRIDGKINPEYRKQQVDKFQERDDYLAAILSITSANAGITLTAAHLVIFAELFWNPGILCQAEDRVHRIGQNDNVIIQYLVAKGTADDYIWPMIKNKINVLNAVGFDQDFSINDVDVAQENPKQQNLKSFVNILSPKKQSDNKEQVECLTPNETASTSTDEFKDLLEIDGEYFNSCDWDDVM